MVLQWKKNVDLKKNTTPFSNADSMSVWAAVCNKTRMKNLIPVCFFFLSQIPSPALVA